MRIGIYAGDFSGGPADLMGQVRQTADAESDGFDCMWFTHILAADSLIAVALAGQQTSRIELVTGVIPIYSRQPLLMAQQALSAQVAAGGRLALGIGLAHPETVPLLWNQAYDRPASFMREYLSVLLPLLRDREVQFFGEMITTEAALSFSDVPPPTVLLAALAPRMLRMAGEIADGTILWMTGPVTIKAHIAPRITAAAQTAGRSQPRICAALPICVTDDARRGREVAGDLFGRYGRLVNYRRVLDIEGVEGPQDVSVVGNEDDVEAQLRVLADAGATDFFGGVYRLSDDDTESAARTRALLRSLVGKI